MQSFVGRSSIKMSTPLNRKIFAIKAKKKRSKAKNRQQNDESRVLEKGTAEGDEVVDIQKQCSSSSSSSQRKVVDELVLCEEFVAAPEEEEEEEILGSDNDEQEDPKDYCQGGYHPVKMGDLFQRKYHVLRKLGWGHFSTVWLCWDLECKQFVALKIVKSAPHYTETALDEIKLLRAVREADKSDPYRLKTVQLLDDFKISGVNGTHVCMVFEVLGCNLLKLIIRSNYQGISLDSVKSIIRQTLQGLHYLHYKCSIIHTDIKPENILLCVDEDYVMRLAAEAAEWQKLGITQLPGSAVSTAPREKLDVKMSKNKKKKLRKKAKQKQERLEIQLSQLRELEEMRLSCQNLDSLQMIPCESLESGLETGPTRPETDPTRANDLQLTVNQVDPQNLDQISNNNSLGHEPEEIPNNMETQENERNERLSITTLVQRDRPSIANPENGLDSDRLGNTEPQSSRDTEAQSTIDNLRANCDGNEPQLELRLGPQQGSIRSLELLSPMSSTSSSAVAQTPSQDNGDSWSMVSENGDGKSDCSADLRSSLKQDLLKDLSRIPVKIADLGNACWTFHHYTEDIQTRQYRCLEVLIGAEYGPPADIWSTACMAFELATGDYLFEPHSGEDYTRDEDHLAHIIELLGRIPREIALSGKYSKDFFNKRAELRHIKELRPWSLQEVLIEKYRWNESDARDFADFLQPMLEFDPELRATAEQCLAHPWLTDSESMV